MKSYKMSLNGTELIYNINEHCVLLGNRRLQLNKDEIFPRPKIYFKINNACNKLSTHKDNTKDRLE